MLQSALGIPIRDNAVNLSERPNAVLDKEKQPIFSAILKPKSEVDRQGLAEALGNFCRDDPSLRLSGRTPEDPLAIGVSGELQLEMVIDRLRTQFQVAAEVERLNVIYLEPIVRIEVTVPAKFSTAVTEELKRRGVRIDDTLPVIIAHARPREMLNFKNFLQSLTGFKETYYSFHLASYRETVDLVPSGAS
jgi:translation elongation factor EF-G